MVEVRDLVNKLIREDEKLYVNYLGQYEAEIEDKLTNALILIDDNEKKMSYKWTVTVEGVSYSLAVVDPYSNIDNVRVERIRELIGRGRGIIKAIGGVRND